MEVQECDGLPAASGAIDLEAGFGDNGAHFLSPRNSFAGGSPSEQLS